MIDKEKEKAMFFRNKLKGKVIRKKSIKPFGRKTVK